MGAGLGTESWGKKALREVPSSGRGGKGGRGARCHKGWQRGAPCQTWSPGLGAGRYPKALGRGPHGIHVREEDWGRGEKRWDQVRKGEHRGWKR